MKVRRCKSQMDGEVSGIEFMEQMPASVQIGSEYIDPSVDEMYSEARGGGLFADFKKRRQEKLNIRKMTAASKAKARTMKASAKVKNADAQGEAAKALGKQDDSALLEVLKQPAVEEKKSNTGLYIGLGLGGLVILGIAGYFLLKKKK